MTPHHAPPLRHAVHKIKLYFCRHKHRGAERAASCYTIRGCHRTLLTPRRLTRGSLSTGGSPTGQATDLLATCQEHHTRYRGGSQQVGVGKIRIVPCELDIH